MRISLNLNYQIEMFLWEAYHSSSHKFVWTGVAIVLDVCSLPPFQAARCRDANVSVRRRDGRESVACPGCQFGHFSTGLRG